MSEWFLRSGWTDPFRELRRVQGEFNRIFGGLPELRTREFPLLNLWAGEDGVVVSAELPGIDPDTVSISVHKNTLTMSGERRGDPPVADAVALRRERPAGAFSRTVTLPFLVDPDKVNARSEAGVILIHLPRPEADKPKRIRIATA